MKILIVEPHKHPRRAEIPHTLEDMQKTVGGYIEVTYPFDEGCTVGLDRVHFSCIVGHVVA